MTTLFDAMHVATFLLFCLTSVFAFEAVITHDRFWHYSPHRNGLEKSYQYFYPSNRQLQLKKNTIRTWKSPSLHQLQQRKKDSFRWKYPSTNDFFKAKMPTIKMPKMPTMRPKYKAQATREWPDYIPPVRMIFPSLDEPPAF